MLTEKDLAEIEVAFETAKNSAHSYVTTPWVQCHRAIPQLLDEIRRLKNRFILLRDMSYEDLLKMEEAAERRSNSLEHRH